MKTKNHKLQVCCRDQQFKEKQQSLSLRDILEYVFKCGYLFRKYDFNDENKNIMDNDINRAIKEIKKRKILK